MIAMAATEQLSYFPLQKDFMYTQHDHFGVYVYNRTTFLHQDSKISTNQNCLWCFYNQSCIVDYTWGCRSPSNISVIRCFAIFIFITLSRCSELREIFYIMHCCILYLLSYFLKNIAIHMMALKCRQKYFCQQCQIWGY
jgi:hypothetical protein